MTRNLMSMEPTPKQAQDKKYLFIDTCVIQFAGDKNKSKSEAVIQCLNLLTKEGYNLAISEIAFYENLQGLWGKKVESAHAFLRAYEYKEVSRTVLLIASILGSLYRDEKIDWVDMGDKIIAATALLAGGFVLTENHKDYPHPFFLTEKSIPLTYITGGKYNKTIDIALYKPNILLISRRIKEKDSK